MKRPRRDPRQDRAAHAVVAGRRPRFDRKGTSQPLRRPRRDPRTIREAQRVQAARPRFDLLIIADLAGPAASSPAEIAVVDAPCAKPAAIVLDDPAFLVLVVPDAPNESLTAHDRQLMGAARALAVPDGAVVALAPDRCAGLDAAGADRRATLPQRRAAYDPDARAAAVVVAMSELCVRHVLFPETAEGGDIARRVAALTGEGLFVNAEAVTPRLLRRPARNRRTEMSAEPPRLVTVAPDAVAPYAGGPREARLAEIAWNAGPVERSSHIVDAQLIHADPATVPLAVADFVASAGNGITDLATFRALAAALAATPGASRVLCDAGLMPRDRQVGASGTILAATCYFALGIAGAPQHLQGVADCEHVLAVNTDLHAAMIERADLAIVQDAQLVMPALLAALAGDPEISA